MARTTRHSTRIASIVATQSQGSQQGTISSRVASKKAHRKATRDNLPAKVQRAASKEQAASNGSPVKGSRRSRVESARSTEPMEGLEATVQQGTEVEGPANIEDQFTNAAEGTITGSPENGAEVARFERLDGRQTETTPQDDDEEAPVTHQSVEGGASSAALHGQSLDAVKNTSTGFKRKRVGGDETERSGKMRKTSTTPESKESGEIGIQQGAGSAQLGAQSVDEGSTSDSDEGEQFGMQQRDDGEAYNGQHIDEGEGADTNQKNEGREQDTRLYDHDGGAAIRTLRGDGDESAEAAGYATSEGSQEANPKPNNEYEEFDDVSIGHDSDFATSQVGSSAPSDIGEDFLKILIRFILTTRALNQREAERKKNLTEQKDLRELMDFNRPHLINAPASDTSEHQKVREKLTANMARYERNLTQRQEAMAMLDLVIEDLVGKADRLKEELVDFGDDLQESPMPQCLKDHIHFQQAYARCRIGSASLKVIELELDNIEHITQRPDRIISSAARLLVAASGTSQQTTAQWAATGKRATAVKYLSEAEEDFKKHGEVLKRQQELHGDRDKAIASFNWRKHLLAKFAEGPLVAAKIIPPSKNATEASMAEVEREEQDALNDDAARVAQYSSQGFEANEDPEEIMTEEETLRAELTAAQDHYYKSLDDFNARRKLTEDEIAQLSHPESDREKGVALFAKGERTTKAFKDAEHRVRAAEDASRAAGILDRYPIQQTWNFEDRPNDDVEYADSDIQERFGRVRPHVERWVETFEISEDARPLTRAPTPPASLSDLNSLELGEEFVDWLPPSRWRDRMDEYMDACDDLRRSGQFPRAAPDTLHVPRRPGMLCRWWQHLWRR